MSIPDAPDFQDAPVAPAILAGSFSASRTNETINLLVNTNALVIVTNYPAVGIPTVSGGSSSATYPVFAVPKGSLLAASSVFIVEVHPAVDSAVTINWPSGPGGHWWVILDATPRVFADLASAAAVTAPGDTETGAGFAILGVTSGGVAEYVQVDSSGHVIVIDSNLANVIAATGAAVPTDAIQVGGSDGTDLRALRVNKQGIAYAIPSAPDTATGDHPPNPVLMATFSQGENEGATVVLAAPGSGNRIRLLGGWLYVSGASAGAADLFGIMSSADAYLVGVNAPNTASVNAPLSGIALDTNTAIYYESGPFTPTNATCRGAIFYIVETV